jgi:sodium-dependent phosphate cotransporter
MYLRGLFALVSLYCFLASINVMSAGLKTLGKGSDWLERLLAFGDNPVVALTGAVLITASVQSSSFTTSLIIALVASGELDLEAAIFAVMGANIGTSVTNTIVSLGSVRIRRQFRRAFTAAIVHDMFNLLTVAMLFPLEWITRSFSADGHGWLTRLAVWLTDIMGLEPIDKPNSPIKLITAPIVSVFEYFGGAVTHGEAARGAILAVLGLVALFISLAMLVRNLKGALLWRLEGLFRKVFFRNDATAYGIGALTTVLVQSSSVTTSLIVPLAGAGAVKLKRVFPYTLGANLGTTITAVLAASANPVAAAVTVAVSHVLFNLLGTAVWYPLRRVPIGLARRYGRLAARSKRYALLFLLVVFLILPALGLIVTNLAAAFSGGS